MLCNVIEITADDAIIPSNAEAVTYTDENDQVFFILKCFF